MTPVFFLLIPKQKELFIHAANRAVEANLMRIIVLRGMTDDSTSVSLLIFYNTNFGGLLKIFLLE